MLNLNISYKISAALVGAITLALTPSLAIGTVITSDTRWSGEVTVTQDTRVAPGATLVIEAGTRVHFTQALSTKTDPQFWSPETELAVEGTLLVEGTQDNPVLFAPVEGVWGGIIAAPGSTVSLTHAELRNPREGLLVVGGRAEVTKIRVEHTLVAEADYGFVLGPGPGIDYDFHDSWAAGCEKGIVDLGGYGARKLRGITVVAAVDAEYLGGQPQGADLRKESAGNISGSAREFVGEYTVNGEESWSGDLIITGRVTVPPGSFLTLEPGTRVFFRKVDSNSDGLGEGELLILGSIRSRGTAKAPVVFLSAEENPKPGDWDKVSIIASEDTENSFGYTEFRHGIQALHAHFSSFAANNCHFQDNLRAVQFQESDLAQVTNSTFVGNKQAIRFRDSSVFIKKNKFSNNFFALHSFRCELTVSENVVEGAVFGGMLAKESRIVMEGNKFNSNRDGVRIKGEGSTMEMDSNSFLETVETVFSVSGPAKVRLVSNIFDNAGLDLIGVSGGELILDGNKLGGSGRDAIHLNGYATVDAVHNFWAEASPPARIHDGDDAGGLPLVKWDPVATASDQ